MWYILMLALSACGNLRAMDKVIQVEESKKDIQRASNADEISQRNLRAFSFFCDAKEGEMLIHADGGLKIDKTHSERWNAYDWGSSAARHYHLKMAQYYATLRDACDRNEKAYEEYSEKKARHAALLKYLHEAPEITFSRTAWQETRRDSSQWLYAFKNSLISIKNDTLEDPRCLFLPNQADKFTAYSLDQSHVWAADNTCKVYNWDTYGKEWHGAPCQLPDTCKQVTAMQEVNGEHAVAIFYKDKNDNKKAGFLLRKNGYGFTFSIVPSAESIDSITWMRNKESNLCGSILGYNHYLHKTIAKYIIHHWNYPDPDQYVEYIMPNPNDSKDIQ